MSLAAGSSTNPRAPTGRAAMISDGDAEPSFDLPSDNGSHFRLGNLRGRKVVLFFYPKDDTAGCTTEVCEFRDTSQRFDAAGALVLGVSPDPFAAHEKFKKKHNLNFPLLSDEDHAVAEAYGVWKEKSMYGRTFWGIERSTFLIDEMGVLVRAWRRVRPKGHAAEVAAALTPEEDG